MSHTIHNSKKLLTRVRRIKGQVGAMETALNENAECTAVLQQVASIRGAVNGLMQEILEEHIREHLGSETVLPEQRQQDLEQVLSILRSYLK